MTPARTTSVYDGRDRLGHLVDRGEAGVEAFTITEESIGLFENERAAAAAIWRRARGQPS
jgi:hypothetical protein